MRTILSVAVAVALAPAAGAADAPRPNVVLVMADDQGWGDMAYNGHPHLTTPHLDALRLLAVVWFGSPHNPHRALPGDPSPTKAVRPPSGTSSARSPRWTGPSARSAAS